MKKVKTKTWVTLGLIAVLIIVVINRYKYNPTEDYGLGTLNTGYDPNMA